MQSRQPYMERRANERFYIDLPALACLSEEPGNGADASRVQIRDISSAGAAFCDGGAWSVGQRVFLSIHVGDKVVGPFSYSLKGVGKIVRKEAEEHSGTSVFAVTFEKGIRMSDWMDAPVRTDEEKTGGRETTKGKVDYL